MADPLGKVRQGARVKESASRHNMMIDTAKRFIQSKHQGGEPRNLPFIRETGIVRIHNRSGADVDRFGVLGIDDTILSPTDNPEQFAERPLLEGSTPADALHYGKFVVLLEPIADENVGLAYIDGVSLGRVNVLNPYHAAADIVDASSANLETSATGNARILWREAGTTGVKWAVLQLGEPTDVGMYEGMVKVTEADNVPSWSYNPLVAMLGTVNP